MNYLIALGCHIWAFKYKGASFSYKYSCPGYGICTFP